MEHRKKLRKHEIMIGVNEKTACGNINFKTWRAKKKRLKSSWKKKGKEHQQFYYASKQQ